MTYEVPVRRYLRAGADELVLMFESAFLNINVNSYRSATYTVNKSHTGKEKKRSESVVFMSAKNSKYKYEIPYSSISFMTLVSMF